MIVWYILVDVHALADHKQMRQSVINRKNRTESGLSEDLNFHPGISTASRNTREPKAVLNINLDENGSDEEIEIYDNLPIAHDEIVRRVREEMINKNGAKNS